jgi:hypothetical protein
LGAVFAILLAAALWVGVFGVPQTSNLTTGNPVGPPPGGPNESIVILAAGTVWDVGAGHFESVWFGVSGGSQVYGQLHASVGVKFWIVPGSAYSSWSGSNGTYGADPPAGSPGELAANWSTGPTVSATLASIPIGSGSYDFIVENTGSVQGASVSVVSDLDEAPFGAD